MKQSYVFFAALLLWLTPPPLLASGPLGIAALVERVEFEPGAGRPQRIRVYGAFAFYDGMAAQASTYTPAAAGFMYFRLPANGDVEQVRKEWNDLAAVAGTGEAVAFGRWGYIGEFRHLDTTGVSGPDFYAYVLTSGVSNTGRFAVHPVSREPPGAVDYHPGDLGIVRLGEGNYAALVDELESALGP